MKGLVCPWMLAAAVATLLPVRVLADVLCQKKSGAVFVRATCKRHEKTVPLETLSPAFGTTDGGHTLTLKNLTAIQFTGASVCAGSDFPGSKIGTSHACTADGDCRDICTTGADALLGHACTKAADCNSAGAADGHCTFSGSCVTPSFTLEGTDWTFSGMNVHVVNGGGDQFSSQANGVGNLIVGYNRSRMSPTNPDDRSGSHNLVLGDANNYTGVGSFVGGGANSVQNGSLVFSEGSTGFDTGIVLGGVNNSAGSGLSGEGPVAIGGQNNTVTDESAVAVGGESNSISGLSAMCIDCVVTGGKHLSQTSGSQFSDSGHWFGGGSQTAAFHWP